MKQKLLFAALLATAAFASCRKNDDNMQGTGNNYNDGAQLNYTIVATNPNAGGAQQKGTASAFVWTSGYAYPRSVKFEAKQENSKIEYSSTNDARIDLMASTANSFGGFTIPDGIYKEIEVKIKLDKKGSEPAMQLEGQFDNGVVNVPVTLIVDENIELKSEMKDVTITSDMDFTAATTLDLSELMDDITTQMLMGVKLTDGRLIISADMNKTLYWVILKNLRDKPHHCDWWKHHK